MRKEKSRFLFPAFLFVSYAALFAVAFFSGGFAQPSALRGITMAIIGLAATVMYLVSRAHWLTIAIHVVFYAVYAYFAAFGI